MKLPLPGRKMLQMKQKYARQIGRTGIAPFISDACSTSTMSSFGFVSCERKRKFLTLNLERINFKACFTSGGGRVGARLCFLLNMLILLLLIFFFFRQHKTLHIRVQQPLGK